MKTAGGIAGYAGSLRGLVFDSNAISMLRHQLRSAALAEYKPAARFSQSPLRAGRYEATKRSSPRR